MNVYLFQQQVHSIVQTSVKTHTIDAVSLLLHVGPIQYNMYKYKHICILLNITDLQKERC